MGVGPHAHKEMLSSGRKPARRIAPEGPEKIYNYRFQIVPFSTQSARAIGWAL
jgi:hypothetical protein